METATTAAIPHQVSGRHCITHLRVLNVPRSRRMSATTASCRLFQPNMVIIASLRILPSPPRPRQCLSPRPSLSLLSAYLHRISRRHHRPVTTRNPSSPTRRPPSGEFSEQPPQAAGELLLLDQMSMPATMPVFGNDSVLNKVAMWACRRISWRFCSTARSKATRWVTPLATGLPDVSDPPTHSFPHPAMRWARHAFSSPHPSHRCR